jgi:16S rRNA processing protein RimM
MIRVGKIVATHGLAGDVVVTHVTGRKGWLKADDVLFVSLVKGSFIPHFITNVKSFSEDEIILHFDETESMEAARLLVRKEVFVQEEMLMHAAQDSPLLWIGFEAIDETAGSLGAIEDIYQTAQQWLATVRINGKEALLPLIDQTLKGVDLKKKQVRLSLPDGLLDIYA